MEAAVELVVGAGVLGAVAVGAVAVGAAAVGAAAVGAAAVGPAVAGPADRPLRSASVRPVPRDIPPAMGAVCHDIELVFDDRTESLAL